MDIQVKEANTAAVAVPTSNETVQAPDELYKVMYAIFQRERAVDATKIYCWVVALNKGRAILNIELMGGQAPKSIVAADVFSMPLMKKAAAISIVRSQPDSYVEPNEQDVDMVNRLIQIGNLQEIPVLEYLIIAEEGYYSFLEEGLLNELQWSAKYQPSFIYEQRIKAYKVTQARIMAARCKKVEKKAWLAGVAHGVEQGRKQRVKEVAKGMLRANLPHELILELTHIKRQQLGKLRSDILKED